MANQAYVEDVEDFEDVEDVGGDWVIMIPEDSGEPEDMTYSAVECMPSLESIDQAEKCDGDNTLQSQQNLEHPKILERDDKRDEMMKIDTETQAALGHVLLQAIRDSREENALVLVRHGADPDAKDSYGFALTQAIRGGYENLARTLLNYSANPNVRDSYGYAITQAIRAGYERFAIELLKSKADPDAKDSYGYALTQAIRGGYENLAWALLNYSVNPNVKDSYGHAITQAIRAGYEDFAIALVGKGADPNSKDSHGSAIAQAVRHSLTKLEKVLLEQGVVAPPAEQKSLNTGQISYGALKISGDIPLGTCLNISTGNGFVRIGSDGIFLHNVSTSSTFPGRFHNHFGRNS